MAAAKKAKPKPKKKAAAKRPTIAEFSKVARKLDKALKDNMYAASKLEESQSRERLLTERINERARKDHAASLDNMERPLSDTELDLLVRVCVATQPQPPGDFPFQVYDHGYGSCKDRIFKELRRRGLIQ